MRSLLKRMYRSVWPRHVPPVVKPHSATDDPTFAERKRRKLDRILPLLIESTKLESDALCYDFLTPALRDQFRIVDTDNVSAHSYDGNANEIIRQFAEGIILDCGAGLRPVYHDNVVNFEICAYPTTDVRGVGEALPFKSGVFDAVFSFNVLEHVRDPFAVAREMVRVLKPGGRLYAVVPFLQPFHAYPHHYYNMTAQGLVNLFAGELVTERQEVNTGGHPVFMLTWVLRRWAESLPPESRREFLRMHVSDLIGDPLPLVTQPFAADLAEPARFELAATTSLFARKPEAVSPPGTIGE
jgi:SAM-dependent methyltransferase